MQKMSKKSIFVLILLVAILLLFPTFVQAADNNKKTYKQTVSGVEINFTYTLNKSNEVVDLVCTNPDAIKGEFTIPNEIDGKKVTGLNSNSFKNATEMTSVTIPKSLKSVDGGTSWKGVFSGCTNLKNVKLEEGLKIIPQYLLMSLPIEEITIPNTVEEIGSSAFRECKALTSITMPSSVKSIHGGAFWDCTNLTKINLGQVEELYSNTFLNCTGLTNITIPKSLKSVDGGTSWKGVFSGCTNLKNVKLEEGLKIIPQYLLMSLPIEEITIPNTVEEIGSSAFRECKALTKITILDNVTEIGSSAFDNHSDYLTIYCYKDSVADVYGAEKAIKRVYLTKPSTPTTPSDDEDNGIDNNNNAGSNVNDNNSGDNNSNNDNSNNNNSNTNGSVQGVSKDDDDNKPSTGSSSKNTTTGKKDNTVSPTILPQTGLGRGIMVIVIIATVYGIYAYRKYNYLKDIK